jgi:hypothetical protein
MNNKKIIFILIIGSFLLNGKAVFAASSKDSIKVTQEVISEQVSKETKSLYIYNVSIGNITKDSVTVIWKTNNPATTYLTYGRIQNDYGVGRVENLDLKNEHKVILTELTSGTIYHLKIRAKDQNGKTTSSDEYSFSTLPFYNIPIWSRLLPHERSALVLLFLILCVALRLYLNRMKKKYKNKNQDYFLKKDFTQS